MASALTYIATNRRSNHCLSAKQLESCISYFLRRLPSLRSLAPSQARSRTPLSSHCQGVSKLLLRTSTRSSRLESSTMPSSWSVEAKGSVYMLLSLLRAFALVEKVLWHQQAL